jgi:hypothetical protein
LKVCNSISATFSATDSFVRNIAEVQTKVANAHLFMKQHKTQALKDGAA